MGGDVIRQGPRRLAAVLRVFVTCKVAAWAIRNSPPCAKLATQAMAIRGFPAPSSALGSWLQFDDPKQKVSAMRTKPKINKKAPMRSKRVTVYATKYAGRLHFRPDGRPMAVMKRNFKDAISRAAALCSLPSYPPGIFSEKEATVGGRANQTTAEESGTKAMDIIYFTLATCLTRRNFGYNAFSFVKRIAN